MYSGCRGLVVVAAVAIALVLVGRFREAVLPHRPVTHVRFNIFPDGGVSRLRLFGRPE